MRSHGQNTITTRNYSLELNPDTQGILQSRISPGLWLAVTELLAGNMQQVLTILQAGLQSPEHAVFVNKLPGKLSRI